MIERSGVLPRALGHLAIRERTERRRGLIGLVDDSDAISVHERGALQEVSDGQWNEHDFPREVSAL